MYTNFFQEFPFFHSFQVSSIGIINLRRWSKISKIQKRIYTAFQIHSYKERDMQTFLKLANLVFKYFLAFPSKQMHAPNLQIFPSLQIVNIPLHNEHLSYFLF